MTKSRTQRTTIKRSLADKLSQKLEQLPEKKKTELTPKEFIIENAEQLESVLKKGYDYEDLVAILKDDGIKISKTTLRQYLREARKTRANQDETAIAKEQHLPEQAPTQQNGKLEQEPEDKPTEKAFKRSPDEAASPTPKKFGKSRLQSDENLTRYPDDHGQPIEMKTDL